MQDRHLQVLPNTILFFILTWLSVSMRVYVRRYMRRNWGLDDTFMVISLVSFLLPAMGYVLTMEGYIHAVPRISIRGCGPRYWATCLGFD